VISRIIFSCFCGILSLLLIFGLTDVSLAQETVTVTPSVDPPDGGTMNPSNPVTVARGSTVEFTATANEGYCLDKFVMDGEEWLTEELGDYGTFRIENIQNNATIVAHFVKCYDIWASVVGEGTINPSGYERVLEGESRTYVITPKPGYVIADVVVNDQSIGPRSELSFEYINSDLTIFAIFEKESFTITVRATPGGIVGPTQSGGTIGPDGGQFKVELSPGEGWTFNIESIDCYEIKEVKIDGELIGSGGASGRVPFTNVRKDYVLDVIFGELGPFNITVKQNTGGKIEPGGVIRVRCGDSKTFTITPDPCYKIKSVKVDGEPVEASIDPKTGIGSCTFSNVRRDHEIEAEFEKIEFLIIEVTRNRPEGGTVVPEGDEGKVKVKCGADQTFIITVNECYSLERVEVDGRPVDVLRDPETGNFRYTFTNVVQNHKMYVVYKKKGPFTITGVVIPDGKILPRNPVTVECGEDQSVTITPNDCWEIEWVDIDGKKIDMAANPNFKMLDPKTGEARYTFKKVMEDHTITVKFKKKKYEIAAAVIVPPGAAGPGGTIAPAGKVSVDCGADQAFTMTPAPGFQVKSVVVDGASVGGPVIYTFRNVRADHTIGVIFEPAAPTRFIISAQAGDGGKIEPSGDVIVSAGADQIFRIAPDKDWHVRQITVDDQKVDLDADPNVETDPATGETIYTFRNVTANHTISVTFGRNGDVNGDDAVNAGDAILALRIAAGLVEPSEQQKRSADMNGDGEVKANDAISILRRAAGL
jgi:hypothetical protein